MTNPFDKYILAAEDQPHIDSMRIDRESELDTCLNAIVGSRQNVLLYGSRGVGKTYLLNLIQNEINNHHNSVFPNIVNIASLIEYRTTSDVGAFPRAILLQLCTELWTQVLGKSYLDLRDSLDETGQEVHFRNKAEQTIRRVYNHLMLLDKTARSSIFNSVGFSAGAKGEKREEASQQTQHSNILPFEFAEFAHELIANVLIPNGKHRLVVLCDEANQMPIYQQEAILERYLELFSSKKIQFIFVAGMVPWDRTPYLPSCFETRLELKGFEDKEHIRELINRANSDKPLTPEAVDAVFEAYSGHPRLTIAACRMSYQEAVKNNLKEVSASIILRAIKRQDEEMRAHEERMRSDYSNKMEG